MQHSSRASFALINQPSDLICNKRVTITDVGPRLRGRGTEVESDWMLIKEKECPRRCCHPWTPDLITRTIQHSIPIILFIISSRDYFSCVIRPLFICYIQYYINGYLMHRVIYIYVGFFYMDVAVYQNNLPSLDRIETKQFPQSGIDYYTAK